MMQSNSKTHSKAILNKVARELNEQPRERLEVETPAELLIHVLHQSVEVAAQNERLSSSNFIYILRIALNHHSNPCTSASLFYLVFTVILRFFELRNLYEYERKYR